MKALLNFAFASILLSLSSNASDLKTEPNWKIATEFGWRGSMHSSPPIFRTWMPPLTPAEKKKHGLGDDEGGLFQVKLVE